MEKAKEARTATENADELESIKLAVVEAMAHSRTAVIEAQDLNNALAGLIEGEVQGTGPWTVKVAKTGNEYIISADGNVQNINVVTVESFGDLKTYTGYSANKSLKAVKGTGNAQQQIIIPAGFKVTEGNKLEDGIVIKNTTDNNEFVWIPVGQTLTFFGGETGSITLGRYDFSTNPISLVQGQTGTEYVDGNTKITYSSKDYYENLTDSYGNTKAKGGISAFVNSALTNKGYYIARFEAGIAGDTNNEDISTTYENRTSTSTKPLSQKGKSLWTGIKQADASTACQNMYSGVNSDLINSYAWDTALIFIEKCGTSGYASQSGQSTNTKAPAKTGEGTLKATNAVDVQCNIYDMAGNVREWTTESCSYSSDYGTFPCVFRGDGYSITNTASYRFYNGTSSSYNSIAFRPTLYM